MHLAASGSCSRDPRFWTVCHQVATWWDNKKSEGVQPASLNHCTVPVAGKHTASMGCKTSTARMCINECRARATHKKEHVITRRLTIAENGAKLASTMVDDEGIVCEYVHGIT